MTPQVAIIDYGMGNLRSVANAFATLSCNVEVVREPMALAQSSHVVLPGVGAFGDGMDNLRTGGWIDPLSEVVLHRKRPFLGICLGMQLLASKGTEHGEWTGLGWVPGAVLRLAPGARQLRIPHIGWNEVAEVGTPRLSKGLGEKPCFYFVHSYAIVPEDDFWIGGKCEYGDEFVATIEHENICGVQFHPEKSHRAGLALLKNFLTF